MVTLRGRPVGSSRAGGSGSGAEQLDDQTQKFISSEITYIILERTPMIFSMVKEGIMELLDECLSSFHSNMVALIGARSLTFREFQACGGSRLLQGDGPDSE